MKGYPYGKRPRLSWLRRMQRLNTLIRRTVMILILVLVLTGPSAYSAEETVKFAIDHYIIKGNTLLNYSRLQESLSSYTGPDKTAEDVEAARTRLEKIYHQEGYPTVLVNIPPQDVDEGTVTLEVIESTIGEVRVTGNRYYTKAMILEKLPVLRRGNILYVPDYQKELSKANRSPELKIKPVLMPGRELGTTDVELKVEDHIPLHGSIEVNNRNAQSTTPLRINAVLHYDNLWQAEHSLTLQYQMSPEDPSEVEAGAISYVLPAPWNDNHMLAAFGVISNSNTAFGEGFEMNGKGGIIGLQYVMPLPFYKLYAHSIAFGVDYRQFYEDLKLADSGESIETPVTYLPFSIRYKGSLDDSSGTTKLETGLRFSVRGVVTDADEFEEKRYAARASFTVASLALERDQKLFKGATAYLKADGQASDQALISSEQYCAGGMMSVRGYHESEAAGDDAVHGMFELRSPDLARAMKLPKSLSMTPFLFFDAAWLSINEALPGQDKKTSLMGTGIGLRGSFTRHLNFEADYAVALQGTDQSEKFDDIFYFMVRAQF